jgi:hypothetical protein
MPDYFTLAELNELPNMQEIRYSDARKEAAAAYIVGIIEREVDAYFVSRTVTDERHSGGEVEIFLEKNHVLSVTSATVGGDAVTDTLHVTASGILTRFPTGSSYPTVWPQGCDNVLVTYEAGYSATPPDDIKEAALQATRWRLMATNSNSDLNARQTSMTNEMGGTVQFAVAGTDRPTGYPEVDAVIVGWRKQLKTIVC